MSQTTFNKIMAIAALALGVLYIVAQFGKGGVSVMSAHIPMWGTALIVLVSGAIMFQLKNLAREEARNRDKE
jgi:ABC-type nickel/cobalt efflux system permease component RcnA